MTIVDDFLRQQRERSFPAEGGILEKYGIGGTTAPTPGFEPTEVPGYAFDRRTGQYTLNGVPQPVGAYESAYSAWQSQQAQQAAAQKSVPTSSFNVSDIGGNSLQLQRDQMGLDLLKLQQEQSQFQTNQGYLSEKLRIEQEAGRSADARATQALQEQIQSRLNTNAFNQVRTIAEAQQLQAQMDFQAAQANAQAQAQAAQINEQRRQANLEQRRGVARDIAEFSRAPGDIGAQASYLTAGGPAPISRALATGQDARTTQGLVPLDLLLANREELAQGPQLFNPAMISAPRVPIPQFQQQMFAPPPAATAPAAGGGGLNPFRDWGVPVSQANQEAAAAALGGGVVEAANGFFGQVDDPTLFLAGESGPENVAIQPMSGMRGLDAAGPPNTFLNDAMNQNPGWLDLRSTTTATTPQASEASKSRDFLNEAFRTALGRTPWAKTGTPTPVALSTPGTSPFLQQMAAALAALGSGISPELYLSEAAMAAPTGLASAPMRRTR